MVVSAWPGWPRFLGKLHQFLALASPGQPGQCHKLYCTPNFTFSANKFLARIDLPVLTLANHGLSRPCRPFVFSLFLSNFGPGQPWQGQARLALWPWLPRFFYPLAYPGLAGFLMQFFFFFKMQSKIGVHVIHGHVLYTGKYGICTLYSFLHIPCRDDARHKALREREQREHRS